MKQNMNEKIIDSAIEYIKTLFHENADGHDTAHSLRVYSNAMSIYQSMVNAGTSCNKGIIALASLLHDVDDHKLFKTENNANARTFLESNHIIESTIGSIITVINGVSFSRNRDRIPETLEGKIVQDADRLDAMGAIGIARTFAFGGSHGRDLDASIAHFYDKLLLLKDAMNTDAAKVIAEERHAYMLSFLEEYKKETAKTTDE